MRFIDLPWAALADQQSNAHRYADHELRENPYIPTLCRKLGVEDFDALWDRLAEIEPDPDPIQLLERIHQLCYHIRASSPFIREEDLRREAFMRQHIRRAQAEFNGQLLVITGGFHSYALFSHLPDAASDEALLESLPSGAQHQGIALTPFSEARLDSLTGYEAGMPSPGFYRQMWRDRQQQRENSYRVLLANATNTLRKRGQIASTADLIAVETSAQALAALRGHAEPWRLDLIDAITSSLIKEAIDPQTRHPFLDALLSVFRGDQRGALAAGMQLPPLVEDIREQLRQHSLEPSTQPAPSGSISALPPNSRAAARCTNYAC